MNLTDFIQLGIGGVLAVIVWLIVQKFLQFVEFQEKNFKETVDNHLKENSKANQNLASVIKELLDYLKFHNGNR
uniref:Uncharacterized protein n=1 Tax=candidate division CPR3 bacterium TaxID=2268181 RepID=A0A7V3JAL9_UNCC3